MKAILTAGEIGGWKSPLPELKHRRNTTGNVHSASGGLVVPVIILSRVLFPRAVMPMIPTPRRDSLMKSMSLQHQCRWVATLRNGLSTRPAEPSGWDYFL